MKVKFCLNMIEKVKVKAIGGTFRPQVQILLLKSFDIFTDGSNVDNPQINSTSKPTSESSSTTNFTDETWQDDNFENPDQLDSQFLRGEEMAVYLAREDVQILSLLGHQFDEMVLSCTYRGVSCRWVTKNFSMNSC